MKRRFLAGWLLCLPACHTEAAQAPPSMPVTAAVASDGGEGTEVRSVRKRVGVGHTSTIDAVALSSDGSCALSRDALGSVRLWPALDGSEEPLVVPVPGAQHMSVEVDADGWTIAVVEPSGGARVLHLNRDGRSELLSEYVPFEPLAELHVRPGGEEVVALFLDHQIVWKHSSGKEIARYGDRRFRPSHLQLTAGGTVVGAIVVESSDPDKVLGEVQRLELGSGKTPTIVPIGSPRIFQSRRAPGPSNIRLSPDGNRLAVLAGTSSKWVLQVLDMNSDATEPHDLLLSAHQETSVGWLGPGQVLVSGSDGNLSWLFDLERGETFARSASPQNFAPARASIRAHAPGRVVSGQGNWLYVLDEGKGERFLGYDVMDTRTVAMAPSGGHVAWGYPQGDIYVEDVDGEQAAVLLRPGSTSVPTQMFFLDDEHLGTIDSSGGVSIYHWRSGRTTAQVSAGGSVRAFDFDGKQGLLTFIRHNGDVRLFEVSADEGFAGPYIVPMSASIAGLWRDRSGGPHRSVLWALEGTKLLSFSLEELRRGVSREELEKRRAAVTGLSEAPRAVDREGARYVYRHGSSGQEIQITRGAESVTIPMGTASVQQVLPNPVGSGFVVTAQSGQQHSLAYYDKTGDEPDWTFASGAPFTSIRWAPDGHFLVLASSTGGVVLDARKGEVIASRCGFGFQARGSAISQTTAAARPICERPPE